MVSNIDGQITTSRLKSIILKQIRPEAKSIYNIHDPIGLHFLFQLRTGLSPLKSHKFNRGFDDTPTDICDCNQNIAEDTKHYLFECPLFAKYRGNLAVEVTNILSTNNCLQLADDIELYLYGNSTLSIADNKDILLSTIRYLKNTNRFSK